MLKPSKPCVYALTGGALTCRYCGRGQHGVAVLKGWVPLYRRVDSWPICVPVDESIRGDLDKVPLHSKVQVGRSKGSGACVWILQCVNQEPKWNSTLPERMVSADISRSLITIWALPEVTQFFCGSHSETITQALAPKAVCEDVSEKVEAELRKQAKRSQTTSDNAVSLADALASHRRFGHLTKPNANGHHESE